MAASIKNKAGEYWEITPDQYVSLHRKFLQNPEGQTWEEFTVKVVPEFGSGGCIMVPWCGMWLGIETDGHTTFLNLSVLDNIYIVSVY